MKEFRSKGDTMPDMYMVAFEDDEGCFLTEPEFYDALGDAKLAAKKAIELHPTWREGCVIYKCSEMIVNI